MKLPSMAVLLLFVLFSFSSASHISTDTSSSRQRTNDEVNNMYSSWLAKHGKIYSSLEEKERRFQIFKDNLMYIEQHNSGNHSYKLGLNQFADLSVEEYRLLYNRPRNIDSKRKLKNVMSTRDHNSVRSGDVLPDSIDWRTKGALVPIKDQGHCGCCWAFATIGSVEAINQIVTGDLIRLSEQHLVDCDRSHNKGCSGGRRDSAFEFIMGNGGIDLDKNYPYTGKDGTCTNYTRKNVKVVSIDGYVDVSVNNESALQKAVVNQPVTVAIDASSGDFRFYDSGIFDGSCGRDLDHDVLLVGYGTKDGTDYWIVRNSWGEDWGDQGYIRMERNTNEKEGKCGIAMKPSYPLKTGLSPPKMANILVPFLFLFFLQFALSLA
ncbi:hypothetical protein SSX86_007711 [Deinandra increscens subsp. villosa]|uniref:Actinidain n=1 Tax=Deinandra increscens subsp. villosa TaxID=3103831 RepID=A0AAP0DIK3_9ASTR